jgi:phage N-6-adenine-methyltransferase
MWLGRKGESMSEPIQKPARSRQDYPTPRAFIEAIERRFGKLTIDLAASPENAVCEHYITAAQDSLKTEWPETGLGWLNPPFGDIGPWAKKCSESASAAFRIIMLTPASVGSNWFAEHVHQKAIVLGLSPRLSFDGKNSYPKDLMCAIYGLGASGFDVWRWTDGKSRESEAAQ